MLEILTIRVYHSMPDDIHSRTLSPFFNVSTPNLRVCSLSSFNFGWDNRLLSGLRVLILGEYFNSFAPSPAALLDVLRQCPELEELALKNISDVGDSEDDILLTSRKIHLLRLKRASFNYSGLCRTRKVMKYVEFPNLESLELAYLENVNPFLQEIGDQALTRLPLKTLRIDSCLFSEMRFINLLVKLPTLVSLQLVDVEDVSYITLKVCRVLLCCHRPFICLGDVVS